MIMPFLTNFLFKNLNTTPYKIIARYAHREVNRTSVGSSFTPVYRFPYVPLCSAINKFKKLQLGVVVVVLPASYLSYMVSLCGPQIPVVFSTVGIASTIALFTMGQFFSRLIGYVYISRNKQQIKLAYLDFWGKRIDVTCKVTDVIPLCDDSPSFSIKDYLYKNVWIYSLDKPLKINIRNGEILDDDLFRYSFYYRNEAGYFDKTK